MKIVADYTVRQSNNYSSPSFKRRWAEHASWGANFVKETGKADFKLFTFPDAKAVFVELAKKAENSFGNIKDRFVQLVFAQGAAFGLTQVLAKDDKTSIYPMENKGDGVFEAQNIDAEEGAEYRFIIQRKDTDFSIVKDPYSKSQSDINGWSKLYTPQNYKWENMNWLDDKRKITRKPDEKLRGLENLIIEEVNIPTLSQEGSFDMAKKHIDLIANKGIATAVEIMPVENTFSLQWGYDGVDKFAVNENMGNTNKLKELIDYIHGKGLNVIMDMVPNHVGPDGCDLDKTGPYLKGPSPFGNAINYEGKNNRYVRDWMANAALWWINEFQVDGLRIDMTKFCESDYLLKQIVEEVNHHNPKAFIIAEDGRENLNSVTKYASNRLSHEDSLQMIDECVNNIANKGWMTYPNEIGFDSEWDFPFMHELKNTILMPATINLDRLDDKIKNSQHRVKFVMSHDEIGNLDGTRLIPKIIATHLDLFGKMKGNSDAEKGQKAAHFAQEFTRLYVIGELGKMTKEEIHAKAKEFGLNDNSRISYAAIKQAFNIAKAKQRLALGTVMTVPGPKMYFQGDDDMKLSYFKFFREFSDDKAKRAEHPEYVESIIAEKGYDTLEEIARPQSILGSVVPKDNTHSQQMLKFMQDLSNTVKSSKALTSGEITNTYKDIYNNVHVHQLKNGDEEVLVLKHFGESFHDKSYSFANFPDGKWQEIFNSDKKEYGGSDYLNNETISKESQALSLAPNSIVILRKI